MLLISSSDGFCSCLTFSPGELGTIWQAPATQTRHTPSQIATNIPPGVGTSTPSQTPTQANAPSIPRPPSSQGQAAGQSPFVPAHPASPARSMSISSVTTQELHASLSDVNFEARAANNQTPQISNIPSLTAANPSAPSASGLPMFTPPQTPGSSMVGTTSSLPAPLPRAPSTGTKREGTDDAVQAPAKEKRRRIQPTLISEHETAASTAASTGSPATAQDRER